MLDNLNGWSIASRATSGRYVMRTADGGRTWRDVSPPEPGVAAEDRPVRVEAYFDGPARAWSVYGRSRVDRDARIVVWGTADGGESWQASQPIDLDGARNAHFFLPTDLHFLDGGQVGWFIAHLAVGRTHDFIALYHTEDGGESWRPLFRPMTEGPQTCLKTGLRFATATRGWLTGNCQGRESGLYFFATQDGGATWDRQTLPPPASAPELFTRDDIGCGTRDLMLFSAESANVIVSCVAAGAVPDETQDYLYTTVDGGANWASVPAPARGLAWLDAGAGWAHPTQGTLSEQLDLTFTLDGGQTWEPLAEIDWFGPLEFVDLQHGWAIAHRGARIDLLQTSDGGRTWVALEPAAVGP